MIEHLEPLVGAPVGLDLLKQKGGPRSTYRARGSRRTAIVKVYEPERARTVASRVSALGEGPFEPRVPTVLAETDDMVVLSEIQGTPLRTSVLAGDEAACRRAGTVLGFWHWYWRGRTPETLGQHTLDRELESLKREAERAPAPIAEAVRFALEALEDEGPWPAATVIHRDLYEEQVMLGDRVGLIDLDDAAIGPPELDVGNLCAHLEFLARRYGRDLDAMQRAFLDGYLSSGAPLELPLLLTCRSLSLLRLGCIHRQVGLTTAYPGSAWPPPGWASEAG